MSGPTEPEPTDAQLVATIADTHDDELTNKALVTLISRYSRYLYRVAFRVLGRLGTTEDIEEVLSDVFVRVWMLSRDPDSPHSYNPNLGSVKTWLAQLVLYQSLGKRRTLIRTAGLAHDILNVEALSAEHLADHRTYAETSLVEQRLDAMATLGPALRALHDLSSVDSDIIIQHYLHGKPYGDIAADMQMSVAAVTVRSYRALRTLRQFIQSPDTEQKEVQRGNHGPDTGQQHSEEPADSAR